jgi:hypothetical protein
MRIVAHTSTMLYTLHYTYTGELIMTCGEQHVKFWRRSGPNLSCQKAVWKDVKKQTMLTAAAVSLQLLHFVIRSYVICVSSHGC